jgi:hypothetical protein
MKVRSHWIWITAAIVGSWVASTPRADAQTESSAIVGSWTLNKDLSDSSKGSGDHNTDNPRPSGPSRGGRRGGYGRMGRGTSGGDPRTNGDDRRRSREALREIMEAPDRLTITEASSMIIITTGDGRTTRLSPDGKKIKDESTSIERKTRWEKGKLVTEISAAQGGKITETYSPDPEHHQLLVTLHIENSRMPNASDIRRVYDLGS